MAATALRRDSYGVDSSGASAAVSNVERNMMMRLLPYIAARKALWIDAVSPRYYAWLGNSDAPALGRIVDRACGRVFTRETIRKRHPLIVSADAITGRPVFLFGAGGASPNDLSGINNGAMVCAPQLDAAGNEIGNPPLLTPGVGFSFAFKTRVPAPSTGGFGAGTGGAPIGSRSLDPANGFFAGLNGSSGYYEFYTQGGSGTPAGWADTAATDRRDNTWHTLVGTYNATTHTMKGWIDNGSVISLSSKTVDIDNNTTPGSDRVMLGGFSDITPSGPGDRFSGFLAAVILVAAPIFEDDATRADVLALLATR